MSFHFPNLNTVMFSLTTALINVIPATLHLIWSYGSESGGGVVRYLKLKTQNF